MADRPLVSIITPSFRRAGFIRTTLESVRAQEYDGHIEHIVVDGGSDDGTIEILEEYSRTYDLRWVSERDNGMYDAIAKGLAMARGDVIAYVNTDDAYLPWSVAAAVSALGESGSDVVFGDLVVVKEFRGKDVSYVQFYPEFDFARYLWSQTLGQPTVFWTRRAMESVGVLDTSFQLIGDCEYWLRLADQGFVPRKLDEVLAIQVDHAETLRDTRAAELRCEFARLREMYDPKAPPPGSPRGGRIANSLRWRRDSWALAAAVASRSPVRWPRFTRFLREEGIAFHTSYALLGLLPGRLRFGWGLSMLDGNHLLRAVAAPAGPQEADVGT
jgi:glycosyltransferase involved in cell wall biosynthesis